MQIISGKNYQPINTYTSDSHIHLSIYANHYLIYILSNCIINKIFDVLCSFCRRERFRDNYTKDQIASHISLIGGLRMLLKCCSKQIIILFSNHNSNLDIHCFSIAHICNFNAHEGYTFNRWTSFILVQY